jgi:ribonuclease PH
MDCTGEFNYYKKKKLIEKSKIYVDFEIIQEKTGYLEAAINGCVVIN